MISPELLRRYPFFGVLNEAQLIKIAMIAEQEQVESGARLFRENQPAETLFLLLSGEVDLFYTIDEQYRPDHHKEFLVGEINPGEIFGISALIEPHLFTSEARAAKDSSYIRIDAAGLRASFESDLELAFKLTHQAAKAALERLASARVQLAAAWA